jgi:uncharacterized membrane protein YciS (DUF1049 family)
MKILNTILIFVIIVASVVFAVQNTETITITFFAWSITGSLSLLLIITLILGFLIAIILMAPSVLKKKFQSFGLRRRVSRLEKEKAKLGKKAQETSNQQNSESPPPAAIQEPHNEEMKGNPPIIQ